jgi:hypothetical protein
MTDRTQGRGDELTRPEGEGWELLGVARHGRPENDPAAALPPPPPEPELPRTPAEAAAWADENLEICRATRSPRMLLVIAEIGATLCQRVEWHDLENEFRQLTQELQAKPALVMQGCALEGLLERMRDMGRASSTLTTKRPEWLSAHELAERAGVPAARQPAFRKALERLRPQLPDDAIREAANPRKNAPRLLYDGSLPAIRELLRQYAKEA